MIPMIERVTFGLHLRVLNFMCSIKYCALTASDRYSGHSRHAVVRLADKVVTSEHIHRRLPR